MKVLFLTKALVNYNSMRQIRDARYLLPLIKELHYRKHKIGFEAKLNTSLDFFEVPIEFGINFFKRIKNDLINDGKAGWYQRKTKEIFENKNDYLKDLQDFDVVFLTYTQGVTMDEFLGYLIILEKCLNEGIPVLFFDIDYYFISKNGFDFTESLVNLKQFNLVPEYKDLIKKIFETIDVFVPVIHLDEVNKSKENLKFIKPNYKQLMFPCDEFRERNISYTRSVQKCNYKISYVGSDYRRYKVFKEFFYDSSDINIFGDWKKEEFKEKYPNVSWNGSVSHEDLNRIYSESICCFNLTPQIFCDVGFVPTRLWEVVASDTILLLPEHMKWGNEIVGDDFIVSCQGKFRDRPENLKSKLSELMKMSRKDRISVISKQRENLMKFASTKKLVDTIINHYEK